MLGRRSTGRRLDTARTLNGRARRRRGRRSAPAKEHQQDDSAGKHQVHAHQAVAKATKQAADQPTGGKARKHRPRHVKPARWTRRRPRRRHRRPPPPPPPPPPRPVPPPRPPPPARPAPRRPPPP